MKRPYLVNFTAVDSDDRISVKAAVTDSKTPMAEKRTGQRLNPTSPIQSIGLISSDEYRIKVEGLGVGQSVIFTKEYESDRFGNFDFVMPNTVMGEAIEKIQVYEVSYEPGIEILMGSYLPFKIEDPKKVIISDFDKTLVDTKYSTAWELFQSLRSPIHHFPVVQTSLDLFFKYTEDKYQPFILSASPHFYENAIRDWLYQNKIYAGNIFLKDYRNIFSLTQGILTTKDLKKQSFYKLNQLVNIIVMTGIPEELTLMGDSFESDEFIYLVLAAVLIDRHDPWQVWNIVKAEKSFELTTKQNFHFLSKFYKLGEMSRASRVKKLNIHIRCTKENLEVTKNKTHPFEFIQAKKSLVEYYIG